MMTDDDFITELTASAIDALALCAGAFVCRMRFKKTAPADAEAMKRAVAVTLLVRAARSLALHYDMTAKFIEVAMHEAHGASDDGRRAAGAR